MSNCAIVGINWGDEGKGRMVDYLTQQYDVVVRYQGGGNAGHTVINEKGKFALHLLPSGIFRSGVMNILGNGVALDCENLLKEIDTVRQGGVDITPERAEKYDFSTPYAFNRTAVTGITARNGAVQSVEEVKALADILPREQLIAKIMGCLNSQATALAYVIQAIADKKAEAGEQ